MGTVLDPVTPTYTLISTPCRREADCRVTSDWTGRRRRRSQSLVWRSSLTAQCLTSLGQFKTSDGGYDAAGPSRRFNRNRPCASTS